MWFLTNNIDSHSIECAIYNDKHRVLRLRSTDWKSSLICLNIAFQEVKNPLHHRPLCVRLWLAKWCKIHKVYIHSHSMLLLLFTNIFIHIQQLSLHSRNIFSHIIFILFTFNGVFLIHDYIYSHLRDVFIHIQRLIFVHIHDGNFHSTFSAHHLCASLGPSSCSIISELNIADGG